MAVTRLLLPRATTLRSLARRSHAGLQTLRSGQSFFPPLSRANLLQVEEWRESAHVALRAVGEKPERGAQDSCSRGRFRSLLRRGRRLAWRRPRSPKCRPMLRFAPLLAIRRAAAHKRNNLNPSPSQPTLPPPPTPLPHQEHCHAAPATKPQPKNHSAPANPPSATTTRPSPPSEHSASPIA